METLPTIDSDRAIQTLLRFLAVEGVSGREGRIGEEIVAALGEIGILGEAVRFDDAHRRIPLPTETGNLIVTVDGRPGEPRRLFVAHQDTVPLCAGAVPRICGDRIVSASGTALGGDNRAGVACLLTMLTELKRHNLRHPPLTLLFTVREESGAWGARCLRPDSLGGPALGFNLDGPSPARPFIGAIGAAQWEAEIYGKAAHAGLQPEMGISASLVVALALAAAHRRGWWGKVQRNAGEGASNVGRIAGSEGGCVGGPSNVVTDYAAVQGEARSQERDFLQKIVDGYRRCFEYALAQTRNRVGEKAELAFRSNLLFDPFRLEEGSAVVRFLVARSRLAGLHPTLQIAKGGLDANWLVGHGIPTVTFGTGQRNVHTREEHVDIPDYLAACRLAIALALA